MVKKTKKKPTSPGRRPVAKVKKVDVSMASAIVTASNLFLPLDKAGNVPANWRDLTDTTRVPQGARLQMPADLLDSLKGRVERAR